MAKYEYKNTWFFSGLTVKEVEKKGFLSNKTTQEYDPRRPDFDAMATSFENAIAELENEGYEVHSILPLQLGSTEASIGQQSGYLGDAGFSLTRGAIIVGRRLAQAEAQS